MGLTKSLLQTEPTRFTVDVPTHERRRKLVGDMVEHGGNFALDLKRRVLVGGEENNGKYNKIEMTRGLVDWHSHPRKCENDNSCALGIPSPDDIHNIVLGHIYGNLGHLVYTKEGTYFIQLTPSLVVALSCNYEVLEEYLKDLKKLSDKLHAQFLKRGFAYKDYITQWCELMRLCGLTIHFFAGNTMPEFTLYINAETQKGAAASRKTRKKADAAAGSNTQKTTIAENKDVAYKVIAVPVDIKRDKQRLRVCNFT